MAIVNPVQIQHFLEGVDYPARVNDLVDEALAEGADDNVLATLQALPDEDFQAPADVSEAIEDLNAATWDDKTIDPTTPIAEEDDEIDMDEEDGDI